MPTISCIMPVYNTAKYLDETIQSILNQSFSDFEFIISDDGSTDGSKEIIRKYAEIDSRIIFLDNQKNRGICANLNDMVSIAKGEYIAIMESDDISMEERFSTIMDYFYQNKETVLIGSNAIYIDEGGSIILENVRPTHGSGNLFTMGIITPTYIVRKRAIPEKFLYKYIWDYELYLSIITQKKDILNVDAPLIQKRILKNGTYNKNWKKINIELLTLRTKTIAKYNLGIIKLVHAYWLFLEMFLINIIKDVLSYTPYYEKIYAASRRVFSPH